MKSSLPAGGVECRTTQMKLAIQEVLDGEKGYRSASKAYNVPHTTLNRKV